MKTTRKRRFLKKWNGKRVPKKCRVLFLSGCPSGVLFDERFLTDIMEVPWRFDPVRKRVRGFFGKGKTRQYMHRFILSLAGKMYPDVKFSNGDVLDMRLDNLSPYDRSEDGACRRPFKNATKKGISFNKRTMRWAAMIRVKGKLYHLGYHDTADLAAKAYATAWKTAHPNLTLKNFNAKD